MKKTILLILTMVLLLPMSGIAAPQKKKNKKENTKDIHHISMWGGAGYSGLVNNSENAKFVGSGGGIIGLGYEYHRERFMLMAGPEFRIFGSKDKVNFPSAYDVIMLWDETMMTKHYTFGPKFAEKQVVGQVVLPIMAGMQFEYVYFLAGAKVGYALLGNYKQSGTLTTSLTDPMAYDKEWMNMPSIGLYTDRDYSASGKNNYGLDAAITAEVGVNIDPLLGKSWATANDKRKYPIHMRASVFMDYGLPNLKVGSEPMALADENAIATTSLHNSEWAGRVNSLLVGVKFTALLQMNKPKKSSKKQEQPAINIKTYDGATQAALGNVQLAITNTATKRARNVKSNAQGQAMLRTRVGEYTIKATRADYLPSDVQTITHDIEGSDVIISLLPIPLYRFIVLDDKTGQAVAATATITDLASNQQVYQATVSVEQNEGSAKLAMGKNYRMRVEAEGYLSATKDFQLADGVETYRLSPIEKKKAIILRNLFFATNETTILPESEAGLQDLYTLLSENPDIRIRITGHTDAIGTDRENMKLSKGRAESVRQEMIKRGIKADRMEAVGKGKTEPIATNDTEEGRAKNRRVEFMIL